MRFSALLLAASVAACSHTGSATGPIAADDISSFNNASVEIRAEGGIAALAVTHRVSHDDHAFAYSMRHLCAQNCGAALDTASGALTVAVTDSLFNIVLAQQPFGLKDDYGITANAADMMTYTLTVRADGNVKTIRADDGTMPPAMRRIVESVRDVIAAAHH